MKKHFVFLLIALGQIVIMQCAAQLKYPGKTLPRQHNTDSVKRAYLKQKKATAKQFAKVQLMSIVIQSVQNSYGYYILADGAIIIEQKNIPAIAGNKGFINETEAKRTADFVIKKIKQGEMPPTITIADLKNLNITAIYPHETMSTKTKK